MTAAVHDALQALEDARAALLAELAVVDLLPIEDQVQVAQDLERFRNRLTMVDIALLAGLDRAGAAPALCQPNLTRLLAATVSVSKGEAARRVRLYETLGPRRSMLGEELGAVRPILAAAVADGDVSAEKAAVIGRGLAEVDRPGFDPADVAAGEKLLTDDARLFGPDDLKLLTRRVVDAINPDGSTPDEALQRDRRHLSVRPTADGGFTGELRLTGSCGAKLQALLRPLAKICTDQSGVQDERTFGQRQHDAVEELCDRLLRQGTVTENAAPVTVIITIDEHDLTTRTGHGTTTTGGWLSADAVVGMASQADLYTAVRSATGVVLDLGRTRRCASRGQTIALIARDIGCSFPGCTHPADYCERHHITAWADGGPTDLNNLTLLCIYHHHNFLSRGWQVRLGDHGLPEWIPPRCVDPHQQPLVNNRIRAAHNLR